MLNFAASITWKDCSCYVVNMFAMDGKGTLYFIQEKQYIKGVFKNGELVETINQGTYTEPKKVSNARKPVRQKSRK